MLDAAPPGPRPGAPRGAWRLVRGGWLLACAWTALAVYVTVVTVFVAATLKVGHRRYSHLLLRGCGRLILAIAGIRLRVTGAEHVTGRAMRIVAFNHASQLDMFIAAAVVPPGGTGIAKKEVMWIPFIGQAVWACGGISIDRGNLEHAKASLARAAQLIEKTQATVMFSPEGTRSRTGELGPFKLGLFHLALATRAPIVPMVIRGAKECQPMGHVIPDPGVVDVEFLPPIATTDFTPENLHDHRDALRALFVRALEARTPGAA